jgi:hypothetical protein
MTDLNASAKLLLDSARGAPPRPDSGARLRMRRALLVGTPAAATAGAVAGVAKHTGVVSSLLAKLFVGTVATAVGAATVWGVVSVRSRPVVSDGSPVAAPSVARVVASSITRPQPLPDGPEPVAATPAAAARAAMTPKPGRVAKGPVATNTAIRLEPEPGAVTSEPDRRPAQDPASPPPTLDARAPQMATQPTRSASVADEVAALDGVLAQTDSGRWAAALDALDDYSVRFGSGALHVEAGGLRVLALCGLGRREEAVAVARALTASAPESPTARRLRHSCVAE